MTMKFQYNIVLAISFIVTCSLSCTSEEIKKDEFQIGLLQPSNCDGGCKVGEIQNGSAVITMDDELIENWFEENYFDSEYVVDSIWIQFISDQDSSWLMATAKRLDTIHIAAYSLVFNPSDHEFWGCPNRAIVHVCEGNSCILCQFECDGNNNIIGCSCRNFGNCDYSSHEDDCPDSSL